MSRPGELRDDELTVIGTGIGTKPARLANVAAAWYAKADAELRERFGFGIEYRSTGAYRTNADTAAIPGALPDGDHERGIALDIRNWGAFTAIDRDDFVAILARNGWRNIDSTGKPFPREPWHHVCTKTEPPAGAGRKAGSAVATLYYCTKTDKPSTSASPQPVEEWALGGDSPGTSANWLTTKSQTVASGWAAAHGSAVFLTRSSYAAFRERYLEPLRIAGAVGAGDSLTAAEVADEIDERARKRLG